MSGLEEALDDYLRLRRALGHKLAGTERYLRQFVAQLDSAGSRRVTTRHVLAFVSDPALPAGSAVPGHRLTAVRGFARYLTGIDPDTEVPPAGLVRYRTRRRTPYVFTDAELEALISAARATTRSAFRADTLETMIRLLTVTGLRVGEAIRLRLGDIDRQDAAIRVRNTKFNKGRDLPVAPSTIEALCEYIDARNGRTRALTDRVFVSLRGTPVDYNHFRATFATAVAAAGIGAGNANPPRVHDLRHRFTIRTLTGWYEDGRNVEALLPRLSTYLGHRDPYSTYWYLSATPELLGHAAGLLEAARQVTGP